MDVAYLGRNGRLDFSRVRDKADSGRISRPLLRLGRICIFPKFSLPSPLPPLSGVPRVTSAAFDTPLDEAITTLLLFILQTLRSLG